MPFISSLTSACMPKILRVSEWMSLLGLMGSLEMDSNLDCSELLLRFKACSAVVGSVG